jgi:hypothetical protein
MPLKGQPHDRDSSPSWIIRLRRPTADRANDAGYAGYAGLVRHRLTFNRLQAHRFYDLREAIQARGRLLSAGIADDAVVGPG